MRYILIVILAIVSFPLNAQSTKDIYPFEFYDVAPEFKGGEAALYSYLSKNFVIPRTKDCYSGKVFVSFVVNENGSISDVKILKGLSKDFNAAAIKVIESMPDWDPALKDGKQVKSRMVLPIQVHFKY